MKYKEKILVKEYLLPKILEVNIGNLSGNQEEFLMNEIENDLLDDFKCPRCHSDKMIRFNSTYGNEIECVNCGSCFSEVDLLEIKDKSTILTIEEKLEILKEIHDFSDLLRPKAIKLLSNPKNYNNELVCQICKKKIIDTKHPNYFQMYITRKREHFITMHNKCALKTGSASLFSEFTSKLDFIYDIDKHKKYK